MKDALPLNRMTVSAQTECPHCRCDLIADLVCWFDAGELRVESLDDIPPEDLLCPECAVAPCITALCHPATYWTTGNTLHVDGGENVVG